MLPGPLTWCGTVAGHDRCPSRYAAGVNERWLDMAQRLFPPIGKRDGLPEGELKAAESRLGFALPAELRTMYRTAGRRRDLHEAWDRLVPPKNLLTVNHVLVIYEEHDRLAAWGIRHADLAADDPPIVRAKNEPPFAWKRDHDTLGGFFFTELLWTHVRSDPVSCSMRSRPSTGSRRLTSPDATGTSTAAGDARGSS